MAPSFHATMLVLAVAIVSPSRIVTSINLAWAIAVRVAEGVWSAGSSLDAVGALAGVLVAKGARPLQAVETVVLTASVGAAEE